MAGNSTGEEVSGGLPSSSPHVHMSDVGLECCGEAQHLLYTTSGLTSFSSLPPSPNTWKKTIRHLLSELSQDKRVVLAKALGCLRFPAFQSFQKLLETLSDIQYQTFVEAFEFADIARMLKYLDICIIPITGLPKPEDDRVQSRASTPALVTPPVPTMPNFETIIRRVHTSPPEISLRIADEFLKMSFLPGCLFPDQIPHANGGYNFEGRFYYEPNPHAFLALDKALLATLQQKFWAENVWIIGPGHPDYTLAFIGRLPDTWSRINKIRLSFSTDDLQGASEMFSTMIESATDAAGNLKRTHLELIERFASHCDGVSRELFDIWLAKFAAIAWLELDDLTLDLNNAYGPDNVFLPNFDWVSSHFPRFNSVVPSTFIILAPTTDLQTDIRRAFDVVNPPRA